MKKLFCALLGFVIAFAAVGWNRAVAEEAFRIGIMTGSKAQAEDDLRGAEAFQARYGKDRVVIKNYPDSFALEREKTVQILLEMANDPRMKAIIVNQAVPGTAEAFQLIKERRPDILCFAGQSHEDTRVIGEWADLLIKSDFISRGYLIIRTAHELGCDTFVHISFPRHLTSETLGRRHAIMQAACEEFGMKFADETAPDPTISGTEEAKAYITLAAPEWIKKYGANAAYYCTNDAHTEPLIEQILLHGGFFIEADLPSPLKGYPEVLGVDVSENNGDFEALLKTIESEICKQGGAGRFGTWAYSFGYTLSAGLAQHAYNVILGKSQVCALDDLLAAFEEFVPGAKWNGANFTDAETGKKRENVFLLYQDTYIMGNPGHFMGATDVKVPEKYYTIR